MADAGSQSIVAHRENFRSKHCANEEDVMFLAACAVSGDWSLLIDETVTPSMMRSQSRAVAEWVVEEAKSKSSTAFPPTLDALRVQFTFIDWPDLFNNIGAGIDTKVYASALLESYKKLTLLLLAVDLLENVDTPYTDSHYQTVLTSVLDASNSLRGIGQGRQRPRRFGDDLDGLTRLVFGESGGGTFDVNTPWPEFNKLVGTFHAGIYGFFARPKASKSLTLAEIAVHNGIRKGHPGLFVDPENPKEILTTRIACCVAGISLSEWDSIQEKTRVNRGLMEAGYDPEDYTAGESKIINDMLEALNLIHANSQLFIIGKDSTGGEIGRVGVSPFDVEHLFRYAREIGANWMVLDQMQEMQLGPVRPREKEFERVGRVAAFLSEQNEFVIFTSNQENRENEGREQEVNWHTPSLTGVAGGDALARKCMWLGHLRMFHLEKPFQVGHNNDGTPQMVSAIQCIWPVAARTGGRTGSHHRLFRAWEPYGPSLIMDNMTGFAAVEADLSVKRAILAQTKASGKAAVKRGFVANPTEETDRVTSPAQRLNAQHVLKNL